MIRFTEFKGTGNLLCEGTEKKGEERNSGQIWPNSVGVGEDQSTLQSDFCPHSSCLVTTGRNDDKLNYRMTVKFTKTFIKAFGSVFYTSDP